MRSYRQPTFAAVAVLALALGPSACGGGSNQTGVGAAYAMGIISGNNQVAPAGVKLPQPVVGKLVRRPDGTVAFVQKAAGSALDLLVPRAYAQGGTVVTGSPIAGGVVCAANSTSVHRLTPSVPCANTESDGTVTLFFTSSTATGVDTAVIAGTVNRQLVVFDTVTAVVTAGPLGNIVTVGNPRLPLVVAAGASIDLRALVLPSYDIYRNLVAVADFPTPRWVVLPADPSKTTLEDLNADQSAVPTDTGWVVHPTPTTGRVYVWFGTQASATVRRFVQVQ